MLGFLRGSKPVTAAAQELPTTAQLVTSLDPKAIEKLSFDRIKPGPEGTLLSGAPGVETQSRIEARGNEAWLKLDVLYPGRALVWTRAEQNIDLGSAFEDAKKVSNGSAYVSDVLHRNVAYEISRHTIAASAAKQLAKNLSKFRPEGDRTATGNDNWGAAPDVRWAFVQERHPESNLPTIAIAPRMTLRHPGAGDVTELLPVRVIPMIGSFADTAMHYSKSASDSYMVLGVDGSKNVHVFGQVLLNHAWGSVFADTGASYASLLSRSPLLKDIAVNVDNARADAWRTHQNRIQDQKFWGEDNSAERLKLMLAARGIGPEPESES